MKSILISILVCSLCQYVGSSTTYGSCLVDEVVKVYDGDTITVNISAFPDILGNSISVRIYGIDTPEMYGVTVTERMLARVARDFVKNELDKAKFIVLKDLKRDKYFRLLAVVLVDGEDLGKKLIDKGLAKEYFGGTKESWE